MVDTGTQGTILPLRIYRQMTCYTHTDIPWRNTTPHAYNSIVIQQHVAVTITYGYNSSKWQNAEFFVPESEGPVILGLPSGRQLRLVTLHCAVDICKPHPSKDADDLTRLYPDRFKGTGTSAMSSTSLCGKATKKSYNLPGGTSSCSLMGYRLRSRRWRICRSSYVLLSQRTVSTHWPSAESSVAVYVCLDPGDLKRCIKGTHHKNQVWKRQFHNVQQV